MWGVQYTSKVSQEYNLKRYIYFNQLRHGKENRFVFHQQSNILLVLYWTITYTTWTYVYNSIEDW